MIFAVSIFIESFNGSLNTWFKSLGLAPFNIFAIVSLPQGVFSSMGAGVKTNLLFFKKDGKPTEKIWYYELQGKFTKKQVIKDEDFEDILKKFENREISENSWITSIDEIKKRDYDLTAKNPNNKDKNEHKEPKELLLEVKKINSEVDKIIKEIKEIIWNDRDRKRSL